MARSTLVVAAILAICVSFTSAQTDDSLSSLVSNPALAPIIQAASNDPALLNQILSSPGLVTVLTQNVPTLVALAPSPTFAGILASPDAVKTLLGSPQLAALANAPAPVVEAGLQALDTAGMAPTSGDPNTDVTNVLNSISTATTPPSSAGGRRLLQQ